MSHMIDLSLSTDEIVEVIASILMFAHISALIWFIWLRREIVPVLTLNLLVSSGVMIYWTPRFGELLRYVDVTWAFVALEFVVFATSLVAIFKIRVPRAVIWTQFAMHSTLIAAALVFMFTFKLTRLI